MNVVHGCSVSGNCHKVRLLLEQLGRPYRWVEVDSPNGATRTDAFLAMNPNGKVPVLQRADGQVLVESNAILHWLAEGSRFLPEDPWQRAQALSWLFFEQYSHEPYIAVARFIRGWTAPDSPRRAELPQLWARGAQALAVMERHLQHADWFTGPEYGIADIALSAYTAHAREGGFDLSATPAITAWLARVRATPGHLDMPAVAPDVAARFKAPLPLTGVVPQMNSAVIPARMKGLNRAEICDRNFTEFVQHWAGHASAPPRTDAPVLPGSALEVAGFLELLESQLVSRHLDLMARVLRVQNKVFYTIGSSGHEGNAMVARLARHTDPAFLHYRSGGFMAERFRKLPGTDGKPRDPVMDSALSFAASADDPASGGRHKVWGSKPLWVLPQTSTIASHLPKALGTALAIEQGRRIGHALPVPVDSIAICSFGDASANHATAQTAFNAAAWTAHQKLPAPVLFVCEDNGIGISVKTPQGWIGSRFGSMPGLDYFAADGLDLAAGYGQVQAALEHCRRSRRPTFLHLRTTRIMGHAGTDFEIEWRSIEELCAVEATDPLLRSAAIALEAGLFSREELLALYERIRQRCFAAAEEADRRPKLESLQQVIAPLAPYTPDAVLAEARRAGDPARRAAAYGGEERLPERQPPRHLAIQINQALHELLVKHPEALLFGEDVAQKGGVYTVTRGLQKAFKGARVFNTLLDETMILGLAQGYANMGMLPLPEIQYLAYLHNAADQLRGEACSLQFFSNDQYRNPMLVRIAGLGYQRGFGGHFHNDNSITALRDIPGLVVGCPSRGDDAATMLRTLAALAKVDGRVAVFLEPIALYMTKDLHAPGDGGWLFPYPEQGEAMLLGEGRVYASGADEDGSDDLVVFTYGNGVPMSLRAARAIESAHGWSVRVVDLRWLVPLNAGFIVEQARSAQRILVVDEGRRSAGVGEGVLTAIIEGGYGARPFRRVTGVDTYTPLAGAAFLVIPGEDDIVAAAAELAAG